MAEINEIPNQDLNQSEAPKELSDLEKVKLGQLNLGLAGKPEDEQSHADDLAEAQAGEMTDVEKKQAKDEFQKKLEQEKNEKPKKDNWPDKPFWAA